jgi:hypothetical protein
VRTWIHQFSPAGTAEGCPGLRRGPFSAVPAGLGRPFKSNPGLASWAKFSRPYGTEFGNGILTHPLNTHQPGLLLETAEITTGVAREQDGFRGGNEIEDSCYPVSCGATTLPFELTE